MMVQLAVKEIKTHRKLYLFVMVQLVLTFIICICCVSSVTAQFRKYNAFKQYFNHDGWLMEVFSVWNPEGKSGISDIKILESYLKSAEVLAYYKINADYEGDGKKIETEAVAYDNEIVTNYQPEMIDGRWLSIDDNDTEMIEAVISQNIYGLEVGDIIEMVPYIEKMEGKNLSIKIVGVLKNTADIYKSNIEGSKISFKHCFYNVGYQNVECPILLMLYDDINSAAIKIEDNEKFMVISHFLLIAFQDGITEEEIQYNQKFLEDNSVTVIQEDLKTVRENSYDYIISQLMQFLPLLIGIFIFTLISTISVSVLVVKQQLKNISIFNMLGLPWNKCIKIQLVSLLIMMLASFGVTVIGILYLEATNMLGDTLIYLGAWQVLACIAIIPVCISASAVVQNLMMKKATPKEIFRNAK